ncbi:MULTISPECIES: hypothetical protein [Stenotrophomonas]|uniref:hypothetical protein n=1 Tax=Stenotrophomonas TaxID=40323 RepID=UPI001CC11A25|nr:MULTISPECIES: hypothetical protein [Stenotrophomonas]
MQTAALLMMAASLMRALWLALLPSLVSRLLSALLATSLCLCHCRKLIARIGARHAGTNRRDLELRKAAASAATPLQEPHMNPIARRPNGANQEELGALAMHT